MSKYNNARQLIRTEGGCVKVALASNVGQGNGGTSFPCAGCYVQAAAANTEVVRVNVGTAASATLGIELGRPFVSGTTAAATCQPLWISIDDISKLYFYSADADAEVQILWLRG